MAIRQARERRMFESREKLRCEPCPRFVHRPRRVELTLLLPQKRKRSDSRRTRDAPSDAALPDTLPRRDKQDTRFRERRDPHLERAQAPFVGSISLLAYYTNPTAQDGSEVIFFDSVFNTITNLTTSLSIRMGAKI